MRCRGNSDTIQTELGCSYSCSRDPYAISIDKLATVCPGTFAAAQASLASALDILLLLRAPQPPRFPYSAPSPQTARGSILDDWTLGVSTCSQLACTSQQL